MTDKINRTMRASIADGPSLSVADSVDVEAYDKIEALIPKSSVPTIVNVQPGETGTVQFIMITSKDALVPTTDLYDDMTFIVDAGIDPITLDGPLMLMGAGLVALLGATCNELTFTNAGTTKDAEVTILVGRSAIVEGA